MKIAFLGTSHAAQHLSAAAAAKGFDIVPPADAPLIFVSEDTPTDSEGRRDLDAIRQLVDHARRHMDHATVVITSAVPPGFTRAEARAIAKERNPEHWALDDFPIWHQAETLRIKDAEQRALNPEMLIVGGWSRRSVIPDVYMHYLCTWGCPVLQMLYEEAEFSKIAINMCLAAQVDTTNRLAAAALKVGARWDEIKRALIHDRRIGEHAYLTPGRWQDSPHLLRDAVTLAEIEAR